MGIITVQLNNGFTFTAQNVTETYDSFNKSNVLNILYYIKDNPTAAKNITVDNIQKITVFLNDEEIDEFVGYNNFTLNKVISVTNQPSSIMLRKV